MAQEQTVDLKQVTQAQQRVWSEGDFSRIGAMNQGVAENLAEAANVRAGERVLDVACGAGNGAIAAARRSWEPTVGLDYVPALLERGRERAAAERLDVEFVEGDAQALPFADESFDVVMSIFGAMFAPDHQRTADELLRVCRPGGRVAMANWVPAGLAGKMFKIFATHVPPPPGVVAPTLWGTEEYLRELFGDRISDLSSKPQYLAMRYHSADHWLEVFRTWFGPAKVAFERVGPDGAEALAGDLRELLNRENTDTETLVVPSEYLEVVAVKA
jgi:ubiquinone/menaquinone biosynthesis C-methylase UbiE